MPSTIQEAESNFGCEAGAEGPRQPSEDYVLERSLASSAVATGGTHSSATVGHRDLM